MTLQDTRPIATTTTVTDNPHDIAYHLEALLCEHPDLELASLRLVPGDAGPVMIFGRCGQLVDGEPGCPSCKVHGDQPHTEYCQLVDHASQLTHRELYGPLP
jgi:hypothetical protein